MSENFFGKKKKTFSHLRNQCINVNEKYQREHLRSLLKKYNLMSDALKLNQNQEL